MNFRDAWEESRKWQGFSPYPGLMVHYDQPKRVSLCKMCHTGILKKTSRLVVTIHHPYRQFRGGGTNCRRLFFHPVCFTGVSSMPKLKVATVCSVCSAAMKSIDAWRAIGGTEVPLCNVCQKEPRFRRCEKCQLFYLRWQTSLSVSEAATPVNYVCDRCALADGVTRVKDQKIWERLELRYLELQEDMRRGKVL